MGWIVPHALTDESRAHLLKIASTASTILLGRKNYQGFAGFWPAVAGDDDADPRDRAVARWLNEADKVVVSRTLTEASWPGSRVVADDPAEVVRRLRKEEGGDIVVLASASVIRGLLEAGELTGSASPCARSWSGGRPPVRRRAGGLVVVADRGHADRQRRALPPLRPDPADGQQRPLIFRRGRRPHIERLSGEERPMNDRNRWIALVVLCTGMLMIVLDMTIVNVALPSMQADLGFSQAGLAWVVNAYLIAFAGLLLLAGRLGDLAGRRNVFLGGLAIFTVASLLCGLAANQEMLIAARFLQGMGGALTSAVILGMIVTMFPEPREQAKAIGTFAFVASAGAAVGLLAGGILTQVLNWHWIFFVNLPVGAATAIAAIRVIERDRGAGRGRAPTCPARC